MKRVLFPQKQCWVYLLNEETTVLLQVDFRIDWEELDEWTAPKIKGKQTAFTSCSCRTRQGQQSQEQGAKGLRTKAKDWCQKTNALNQESKAEDGQLKQGPDLEILDIESMQSDQKNIQDVYRFFNFDDWRLRQ